MISVLYFIRKINAQYNNNTKNIRNNGKSIEECMVLVPVSLILAGWWSVFHQSTEYLTIGTLTKPIIAIRLEALSALSSCIINLFAIMNPMKKIASINIEVILASQAHQVPQVGFPQIDPVTKAIMLKTKPEGAKLFVIKEKFLFLKTKTPKERMEINENIPSDIQADGTWTYIILTESLCL